MVSGGSGLDGLSAAGRVVLASPTKNDTVTIPRKYCNNPPPMSTVTIPCEFCTSVLPYQQKVTLCFRKAGVNLMCCNLYTLTHTHIFPGLSSLTLLFPGLASLTLTYFQAYRHSHAHISRPSITHRHISRPSNGGNYCLGERKRYRTCNTEPCSDTSVSFREQQCAEFNEVEYKGKFHHWVPVQTGEHNRCTGNLA